MNRIHERFLDKTLLPCVLIAVATLLLAILFWPGLQATDDLGYASFASYVLKHGFHTESASHFVGRIGAYWPLAGMFWLFGVNELSLSMIPILSTAAISVLLFLVGRQLFSPSVGLTAGFLHAIFPLTLRYGTMFVPEPILGVELCAAAILFLNSKPSQQRFYDTRKLVSGFLAGLAYLTTEAGVLILPTFLVYHFVSRKASRNDWSLVFGFLFVLFAEMVFYEAVYANPLHRFTGLGGRYISDPWLLASNEDLFDRLIKAYPRCFVYPQNGLGFFGPLLIAGGLFGLFHIRKCLFLLIWAGTILLFYNFMSVRLDKYIVLPAAVRFIYTGCLPLLILSAWFLVSLWQWTLEGTSAVRRCLLCVYGTTILWLFLTSILIAYLDLNIGFNAVLGRNAKAVSSFLKGESPVVLISDHRTLWAISFYRGFSDSDTLVEFDKAAPLLSMGKEASGKKNYVVINGPIYHIPEGTRGFFPFNARHKYLMDEILRSGRNTEFYFKYTRGELFQRVMAWGISRRLLGEYGWNSVNRLILGQNAVSWVIVLSNTHL
jgi:4-amino-4-deoxy-L-arabinose transferase-like glycosyltransferase